MPAKAALCAKRLASSGVHHRVIDVPWKYYVRGSDMELTGRLQQLRQSTPELDLIMRVFEEADKVNAEAQIAMGQRAVGDFSPVASTRVAFTLAPDASTQNHPADLG